MATLLISDIGNIFNTKWSFVCVIKLIFFSYTLRLAAAYLYLDPNPILISVYIITGERGIGQGRAFSFELSY